MRKMAYEPYIGWIKKCISLVKYIQHFLETSNHSDNIVLFFALVCEAFVFKTVWLLQAIYDKRLAKRGSWFKRLFIFKALRFECISCGLSPRKSWQT